MKQKFKSIIAIMLLSTSGGFAQSMQQNFQTPPQSAKPRVWWHWMNEISQKRVFKKI